MPHRDLVGRDGEHRVRVGSDLQAAARRAGIAFGTAREYLERVKRKYTDAGRPTYTKLDLADRVREDRLELDGM